MDWYDKHYFSIYPDQGFSKAVFGELNDGLKWLLVLWISYCQFKYCGPYLFRTLIFKCMQLCLGVYVCVCVCVSACLRACVCVCVCLCHTHTVPQWRSGLPAGCLVADGLIALYWATQLCQRARACIFLTMKCMKWTVTAGFSEIVARSLPSFARWPILWCGNQCCGTALWWMCPNCGE